MYLPTSHGFDSYLGIPFSQDMGLSYWFFCNGPPTANGKPPVCDPKPTPPYQPTPIPLLSNTTVIWHTNPDTHGRFLSGSPMGMKRPP